MQKNSYSHEHCRNIVDGTWNDRRDPGVVKLKRYDAATGIETLDVEQISKVQATQRRESRSNASGEVLSFIHERKFPASILPMPPGGNQRASHIERYSREILELDNMDVLQFDFLDRPKESALKDALKQLYVLDAIDESGKITQIGKEMAPLPLEPNLARAMLEAKEQKCAEECATVAAMLSVDRLEVAFIVA